MNGMRTPDGWTVHQVTLDNRQYLAVRFLGALRGGDMTKFNTTGLHTTIMSVKRTMGDAAFEQLEPIPAQVIPFRNMHNLTPCEEV
jgi:hypothetical protein